MQRYLNGVNPHNQGTSTQATHRESNRPLVDLPEEIDVLIVGCGPAGLTLAAQLAAFPSIRTRIIDKQPGPLLIGQADGVACRTIEIFEAFGFSERVIREAYFLKEIALWRPDDHVPGNIVRASKVADNRDGLSEFPHVVLSQARVHEFLLDAMRESPGKLEPDYSRRLLRLTIDREADYPVTVTLERVDPTQQARMETVRARYIVGCDGARSTVRDSLARPARGDSANKAWGVMDLLAVTDYPDIRLKSIIQSANDGNLLMIPREGGYLVRYYIELDQLSSNERASSLNITSDDLISAAQRIMHPYSLDVKEVAWWSVYQIGQRLCDRFDDVPEEQVESLCPHVFIAGDACHTHSPKAGQGMNVSMHDSFNLGWKLAAVIQGQSSPQILHTYTAERQTVASELIEFDRKLSKMFSARPESQDAVDTTGADPTELQKYLALQSGFVAGTAIQYYPSVISADQTYQHLAEGFEIGKRFHSAPVIRLADARPVHLGHTIKADGRWRIFVFAGADDPAEKSCGAGALAEFLANAKDSPIRKYTPTDADIDSVFDVYAIFQESHTSLAIETLPEFFLPRKGVYGLCDYEKIFCPDVQNGADIFDSRGINRESGCLVVVRPDQHVAHVLPLDATGELAAFFAGFMMPCVRSHPN